MTIGDALTLFNEWQDYADEDKFKEIFGDVTGAHLWAKFVKVERNLPRWACRLSQNNWEKFIKSFELTYRKELEV